MISTKLFIGTKDLMAISGKSDRQCRREKAKIKKHLKKKPHHELTIHEYCLYKGIPEDEVRELIGSFESRR